MWPFSPKKSHKTAPNSLSVASALEQLASVGVRVRPGITNYDLLDSLGGTMDSQVDWVDLLCVLGSELEGRAGRRISDDIWHFDAECIVEDGDYVDVIN